MQMICPGCARDMEPMKTADRWRCRTCKTKIEQLNIFDTNEGATWPKKKRVQKNEKQKQAHKTRLPKLRER